MFIHNEAAKYHLLDFIYKSFSVDNIKDAIAAMKTLNFRGAGISMPFKTEVIQYLDLLTEDAQCINAVNTVVNENGKLVGHNTDWIAATKLVKEKIGKFDEIVILGKGGLAKAVEYAVKKLGYFCSFIDRKNWETIPKINNKLVFNCTPVSGIRVDPSNEFIDCLTDTETGERLALIQASVQFELYTNKAFPYRSMARKLAGRTK